MKVSHVVCVLAVAPAILGAQSSSPSTLSADASAKIDASVSAAHRRNLPEQPIRDRVAEGQAKGASEAQIVVAAQRTEARMEAAQSAMARAGRTPTDAEVTRGEHAMARGTTDVQIEALARRTPSDRSMEVALDVLTQLQARGVPTANAVAQIESKLSAHASDAALLQLPASVNASATAAAAVNAPRGSAAATTGTSTSAAAGSAGAAVAGAATAGVGAVIKPPV
jgi:hypothetical protein